MTEKLVSFNGGKKDKEPRKPRKGVIVITLPDADDPRHPIHLDTEQGDPLTLPELVFALVTATTMLTIATPVPDKE